MKTTAVLSGTTKKTDSGLRDQPHWIDDVLADSCPASDPPSWTAGTARPAPRRVPFKKRDRDAPTAHADQGARGAVTVEAHVLRPGDQIPHFEVTNVQGQAVSYSTIWQRKNFLLVTVPVSDPLGSFAKYIGRLAVAMPALTERHTECVITRDVVAGAPSPGIVVADRWGEIVHVARGSQGTPLPEPDELLEWIDYVQHQCPECQGEAN
jgi:hypothetical protein